LFLWQNAEKKIYTYIIVFVTHLKSLMIANSFFVMQKKNKMVRKQTKRSQNFFCDPFKKFNDSKPFFVMQKKNKWA